MLIGLESRAWKTANDSSGMIGGAVCLKSKRELRQSWTWYPIVMELKRGMGLEYALYMYGEDGGDRLCLTSGPGNCYSIGL